jgi:uncharacterized protein YndB with AHSA1/START domain
MGGHVRSPFFCDRPRLTRGRRRRRSDGVGSCSATVPSKPVAFYGRYLEVTPHSRIVWTNDESDDGAVTTVTFEEKAGKTLLVM